MVIFGHYRIFVEDIFWGINGYLWAFSLKSYLWALTDITGIFVDKGRADAFMN